MATGTSVGTSTFVLGRDAWGNRETRTFVHGESYDLDPTNITAYTVQTTKFPYNVV